MPDDDDSQEQADDCKETRKPHRSNDQRGNGKSEKCGGWEEDRRLLRKEGWKFFLQPSKANHAHLASI